MFASAQQRIPKAQRSNLIGSFQMDPHLLPEEKLAVLQAIDARRKWHSLDDQWVCVLCGRAITGRQIDIVREPGGTYSARCPTPECSAVASDWFYQGNASSASKAATLGTREANIWSG